MEFTQFLSYVCPGKNYFFGNYMFCKKKFAAIIVTSLRNFYHTFVLERIIFLEIIYFAKKKFAAIIVTSLRNFYHIFVLERIIFWRLYILQRKEICCHYCHIFVFIF